MSMEPSEFVDYKNEEGCGKDIHSPFLKDVSLIQFREKSTKMFYKNHFNDAKLKECEFLKKKTRKAFQKWRSYPSKGAVRGITHTKKEEILKKLSCFMSQDKVKFREDLASNVNSIDLTINMEHLPNEKNK